MSVGMLLHIRCKLNNCLDVRQIILMTVFTRQLSIKFIKILLYGFTDVFDNFVS